MESDTSTVVAGRYALERVLGRGGMADVYGGTDLRLTRPVAVKVLRDDLTQWPDARTRFESEATLMARVEHPNVVTVFDSGTDDHRSYIVMERLPGTTLADEIRSGPLPWNRAVAIVLQVLGAVDAAHRAGVIHRDLKPSNVLLCDDGTAKVSDFGIAKSGGSDQTATGLVLGSPTYLAPERLTGAPATVQSDIFAVGALLFCALTGNPPGPGIDVAAALRQARPDVPDAVAAAAARALAADPSVRYATAADMAGALRLKVAPSASARPADATAVLPAATTIAVAAPPQGSGAPRRSAAPWLVLIAALVVLGVVLLASRSQGRGAPATGSTTPASASAPPTTAPPTTAPPTTAPPTTVALPPPLDDALRRLDQVLGGG